ncbi:MAG: SulP family inorganic anion transporter [Betaproteobacteria bacterium]
MSRWRPEWLDDLGKPGVLRADTAAALTGAIVVLPQAFAFASLAGLPPQYGVYTAIVPCIVAALLGSSRLMVTGPANAISLTVLALLAPLATPESKDFIRLAITLSFMVGVLQLTIGLTKIARWVERVPHSVIVGFTAGAAILIVNSQIGALLGLDWSRAMSVSDTATRLWHDLPLIHWPAAAVSGVTVLACVAARPFNHRVPYLLVGIIAGSVCALALSAAGLGERLQFAQDLGSALPVLSTPDLSLPTLQSLLVPALIMTLLGLAEAVSIASAIALRSGHSLDGPREVRAQGVANIAGSFFSAYPASGSFNRSGVTVAAGAVTPLASVGAALFLGLIAWVLAPLARWLPLAAVAAILLVVAALLIDTREIRAAMQQGPRIWLPLTLTFVLTLSAGLEWAIVAGLVSHAVLVRIPARSGEDGRRGKS